MPAIETLLVLAFIAMCVGVAFALAMLNNKVNKEARERMVRFVQNFDDMMKTYKETDDYLLELGKHRLKELRQEMDELLEYGGDLYDGICDRAIEVRDRVKRLIERV